MGRSIKCEICGKAGSRFVMLGQKGSNNADFYWICEHCEKAIRWVFARIDDAQSKREENDESPEEEKLEWQPCGVHDTQRVRYEEEEK